VTLVFDQTQSDNAKAVLARLRLVSELASIRRELLALPAGIKGLAARLTHIKRANEIRVSLGAGVTSDNQGAGEGDYATNQAVDGDTPSGMSDDDLSDDPNAENYRFKDTGHVAGSRKEQAASIIRRAKEGGHAVLSTDIDWQAIEENPREAEELISKNNLFGKTDWDKLQIDKVFAAIGPKPSGEGSAQLRQDYVIGLQTIRDRLEPCQTVAAVTAALAVIRDELDGSMLNEDESARWQDLMMAAREVSGEIDLIRSENDEAYQRMMTEQYALNNIKRDIQSRERRKWKSSPELELAHEAAERRYQVENANWGKVVANNKDREAALRERLSEHRAGLRDIQQQAKVRNAAECQEKRSWVSFGEKFANVVNYRRYNGSKAFAGHVTNAAFKVKDWSWCDKTKESQPKKATKREVGFKLLVADNYTRVGGRNVAVQSTAELKERLGLREVQSGNWVLNDPNSARFHVEQTAAAMADLSDILGIDEQALGLGGRLAMAFGARGRGGANAALAHYEPVQRVINLTKMGGGGTLGHELLHALDNIIPSLVNGGEGSKEQFATDNPDILPPGPLREAFARFRAALIDGDVAQPEWFTVTDKDRELARLNIDPRPGFALGSIAMAIKQTGNATEAVRVVRERFGKVTHQRVRKQRDAWVRIAVAYYEQGDEDGRVSLATGPAGSSFLRESQKIDAGRKKAYWGSVIEMAARAFQCYCEDKLAEKGQRNDYLSCNAANHHYDPGVNPFPEGEEREKINAAIDALFAALRQEQVFEQAMQNQALLDSIFGVE